MLKRLLRQREEHHQELNSKRLDRLWLVPFIAYILVGNNEYYIWPICKMLASQLKGCKFGSSILGMIVSILRQFSLLYFACVFRMRHCISVSCWSLLSGD